MGYIRIEVVEQVGVVLKRLLASIDEKFSDLVGDFFVGSRKDFRRENISGTIDQLLSRHRETTGTNEGACIQFQIPQVLR